MGYEIRKSSKKEKKFVPEIITIQIGDFNLKVNSKNILSYWYRKYPKYNSELVRAAEIVQKKYPQSGIIDIGANVGDTLCLIKSKVNVNFICIEGDSFLFELLTDNLKQFNDIIAFNYFLGEKPGCVPVITEKDGWNTTLIPSNDVNSKEIEINTLDRVLKGVKDAECYKFLKIDTEGFDMKIIRGGLEFIKKSMPVIFLEYNRTNMDIIKENGIETLFILQEIGYNKLLVYENMGRFILSTTLDNHKLINQLHEYIDGKNSTIPYFDFCLFHSNDEDIANEFIEREERLTTNGIT